MKSYESPRLTKVGSVSDLTQGHLFQQGQDNLSWIPVIGSLFGQGPRPPGGGGGGGGGFGS